MQQKPITLSYHDFIKDIVDTVNHSGLPAFAVIDVLEKVLVEVRKQEESELKRDEAMWHKICSGVTDNGGQSDKPVSDENDAGQ